MHHLLIIKKIFVVHRKLTMSIDGSVCFTGGMQ